jgi:hypothetical protein
MSHPETRPRTRAVLLNAVLVAVLGAATTVGVGARTGPDNSSATPTDVGARSVSYTVTIPTPTIPAPAR